MVAHFRNRSRIHGTLEPGKYGPLGRHLGGLRPIRRCLHLGTEIHPVGRAVEIDLGVRGGSGLSQVFVQY